MSKQVQQLINDNIYENRIQIFTEYKNFNKFLKVLDSSFYGYNYFKTVSRFDKTNENGLNIDLWNTKRFTKTNEFIKNVLKVIKFIYKVNNQYSIGISINNNNPIELIQSKHDLDLINEFLKDQLNN
jgi:hypothetical protein